MIFQTFALLETLSENIGHRKLPHTNLRKDHLRDYETAGCSPQALIFLNLLFLA
jgi:hypothetical protein